MSLFQIILFQKIPTAARCNPTRIEHEENLYLLRDLYPVRAPWGQIRVQGEKEDKEEKEEEEGWRG